MNRFFLFPALALLCLSSESRAKKTPSRTVTRDSLVVRGPINIEVDIKSGPVEIILGKGKVVEVIQRDGSGRAVKLVGSDGDIRVLVDGDDDIAYADLQIRIPANSDVEVTSIEGDVSVSGVGGDVEIEVISGRVNVAKAADVEVESVSGAVVVRDTAGSVSVETVSGDVAISNKSHGNVEIESVSGSIGVTGLCGARCEVDIESLSGSVDLKLSAQSAFEIEFESFSGALHDKFGLSDLAKEGHPGLGMRYRGTYKAKGKSGEIDCESYSGSLRLTKN